jgi:predicted aspartyl protease
MRRNPFCAFLIGVGYFSLFSLLRAQTMTARVPMSGVGGLEIVQVSINGAGPYDFILDTGANLTLVKRQLLRKLNIYDGGPVTVVAASGESQHQRTTVKSIAVGGLCVERLEVIELERAIPGPLGGRVQGILGENFLKNFDILIDNEQQTLILDRTSSLADRLAGEHLQLLRFGSFNLEPTSNRIVVTLKVPSFLQRPLLFLVDSGANTAMLYPERGLASRVMEYSQPGDLLDISQTRSCRFQKATLEIGSGSIRDVHLVACEGMTRDKIDTDGLLPTSIFHKLFISHKGAYVITNPLPAEQAGDSVIR